MDLDIRTEDGVRRVRFDRPDKKNALTGDMYDGLADALESGENDPAVSVFVFLGHDGVFTAGNDLGDFLKFAQDGALGEPVLRFLGALARTSKPMIAAVDGLAIGIGTTMLFHCDLVYASERAAFRTPFLDLGLVPEAGSSLLAPRQIGYHRAFELLCLGQTFDGEAAVRAGFVNALVPAGELEARAMDAARRLADKPAAALAMARGLMRGTPDTVAAAMDAEAAAFRVQLRSPEAQEAFSAFLEKRPANFRKLRR